MSEPEIITLGCRLNIAESEAMRQQLGEQDDLIVVNSCAVTGEAVRHTRQAIRRAHRRRPAARIVVTGCAAQIEPETFAAMPDLLAMLKRRSSAGMNPRMAAIMGVFQVAWVYYGLLIVSRPVILWNLIAIVINGLSVGAYMYFLRKERARAAG